MGFCFSFALEQAALNSGKLLVWSKGFTVDGVIGKDVVQLLSGTRRLISASAAALPVLLVGVKAIQHRYVGASKAAAELAYSSMLLP